MATPEARLNRWRVSAYAVWAIIGGVLILGGAGYVLGRISSALAPFVLAFLFVLFMQGIVARLSDRGMGRGIAVALCFTVGFVVVALTLFVLLPPLGRQMVEFANAVPGLLEEGRQLLAQTQAQMSQLVIPDWLRDATLSIAESMSSIFVRLGNTIATGIVSAGGGIATVIFDVFLGIVIAYWTLKDLPTIREELRALAGEKYEDDFENLMSTIVRIVGGYIRGQTIASLVTGTLAGIGLAVIGVPFATVLGVVTFVLNYIPYVGPLIAGALAFTLGLFEGPWIALGAIVVVVVAQNLTDALVTPRVMSDQVDLHPTLVIFSLLAGGALFGFWGMIFAIPIAATGKALFVYYYERKTQRQLVTEDGALFKAAVCEPDTDEACDSEDAVSPGGSATADTPSAPNDIVSSQAHEKESGA